jgi:hypothetical protein
LGARGLVPGVRGKRVRWANVGRLAAVLAGCLALLGLLPRVLAAPEPPPLPPDVGLAPEPVTADAIPRRDAQEGLGRERARRGDQGSEREPGKQRPPRSPEPSGEGGTEPKRDREPPSEREARGGDGEQEGDTTPSQASTPPPQAPIAPPAAPAPAPTPVPAPAPPPAPAPGEFGP